MLSLLPFRVFFPTHFKPRLFSQYTSPSRKPLAHPVDPLKKKKIFGTLFNDQVVIFPARNPPQKCFRANLPVIVIPYFKNYYIPQEPSKSHQQPSCPTHWAERKSNIPFRGYIGQRHLNTMSDVCPPKFDRTLEFSRRSYIKILMFSWPFLVTVLVNVFLRSV